MSSVIPNQIRFKRVLALFLRNQLVEEILRFGDLLALVACSHYSTRISLSTKIVGRNIRLGKNCQIEGGSFLGLHNSESPDEFIKIGDNCEIRRGAQIRSWMGWISIGNDCSVNPNTILLGTGGITIGNHVRIAGNSFLVASSHKFDRADLPISDQGYTAKGITIEDNCWIGSGVAVLDGVTIQRGCVIGAGAVVNKSTDINSIYAGVPARKLSERN
jgi:acetyltransferase-like isoleucine patch superfamily enzyme